MRIVGAGGDGKVVEERLAPDRHQRLGRAGEIVPHLVIVPVGEHRRATEEVLHRAILAVVAMLGAVRGQRAGHEVGARHHVGAIARHVGVDRVAGEEEEVDSR